MHVLLLIYLLYISKQFHVCFGDKFKKFSPVDVSPILDAKPKGFGNLRVNITSNISAGPTRAEKKEKYRQLLKIAKTQPSLHKMASGNQKDIFIAQKKQAW
jgi:hypothetical protein